MKIHCFKSTARLMAGVLLALCSLGHAVAAGEPQASIQMIAFAYSGPERGVTITDGKGVPLVPKPVKLPTNQCSQVMQVASRDLQFTLVENGEIGGQPAPGGDKGAPAAGSAAKPDQPKGRAIPVSLPGAGKDFVLVFLPLPPDKGGGYRIHAVELPADRFKSGSYAFLNYTNAEIYCGLDKQKVVVAPAKAAILAPEMKEGVVKAACFEKSGEAWAERPFFSGRVPVQQGVRNLVLVSRDPGTGQIDFRGVPDFLDK